MNVLDHYHNIHSDIEKYLSVINEQNNLFWKIFLFIIKLGIEILL